MEYILLIIIGFSGVAFGAWFSRCRRVESEQSRKKREGMEKVLVFVRKNGRVANNDVETLVGVSHATAERYLDELEKEGMLKQNGEVGTQVFYTLK